MDSHVMENVTLTRISSKLPLAMSWPRPSKDSGRRSPEISDVMECQTTSCHDPTCGEVCLQYCVRVLRHSHIECVPFCRTCGVTGMRAVLSWLYFYTVSDVKRRNFSRAVKFFVEEPHQLLACLSTQHMNIFEVFMFKRMLLSPSYDTTCCASHFPVRRRTANNKLNRRPCMYAHVLEESAEVRNTDASRRWSEKS